MNKYFLNISIIFLLLLLKSFSLSAQETYEGVIKDKVTEKPLTYINIGILNKNVGTVSDTLGKFNLKIDKLFDNDTLRISSIGYETYDFKVIDFKKKMKSNSIIYMKESVVNLPQVTLSNKPMKEKVVGNRTKSKMIRGGFTNSKLGNELGIKIKTKSDQTIIKSFNTYIISNTSESMKFKLNFYNLKKGLPHKKIVKEPIIFSIDAKQGEFVYDLSDYDIVMTDDFFISIELVENYGDNDQGIFFSGGLMGSSLIARETSQGNWKKYKGVGIGFSVSTKY